MQKLSSVGTSHWHSWSRCAIGAYSCIAHTPRALYFGQCPLPSRAAKYESRIATWPAQPISSHASAVCRDTRVSVHQGRRVRIEAIGSMADGGRTAELDLAQGQRQRHGHERDQHQNPKHVHVGEERRLGLHLLPDPLDRLLLRLEQRVALRYEVVRHPMERVLILHARRNHALDQPTLMELLAMRQHVGGER